MGLAEDAIDDAADFLEDDDDFAVPIVLTSPDGQTASVTGYSRKISQRLDQSTGMVVNSKNASVTVHERTIAAANANYPVRNDEGEVAMLDHRVEVADSTGQTKNYQVAEQRPNETTGTIVLILRDWTE